MKKTKRQHDCMNQNQRKNSLKETACFCCVPCFQTIVSVGSEKHLVYSWNLTTLFKHVRGSGGNGTENRCLISDTNLYNAICPFFSHLLHYKNINYPVDCAFSPNCSLPPGDRHSSLKTQKHMREDS